jgi:tRNA-dihydrouridine synthase A
MNFTKLDNITVDINKAARFSVAPMMDWTDRHCRYFHRQFTKEALLYTEMIASAALVTGKAFHLLDHLNEERPVALQLGGSDPIQLSEAASIGEAHGYDEINLNVGCPSDRVQSGSFGAVLMKHPKLVASCCEAMIKSTSVQVTVKCRIGVDEQNPNETLPKFLEHIKDAGVKRVIIHARKAILKGLSPKQNRDVPPLDYDLVFEMKNRFPNLHISLNGGVSELSEASEHISKGMDGVMIGRSAYQRPNSILTSVDRTLFGHGIDTSPFAVAEEMRKYILDHCKNGGRPHQVTRHMMGLFYGFPGAKAWRSCLSQGSSSTSIDYYDEAIYTVSRTVKNNSAA